MKSSQTIAKGSLPGLIIIPAFIFPLMAGVAVAVDMLAGDRQFLFAFLYESKRTLLLTLLTDWAYSLPWAYAISIILYFLMRSIGRRGNLKAVILPACVTAAAGILGWQLSGTTVPGAIFAIGGFALVSALRLCCATSQSRS